MSKTHNKKRNVGIIFEQLVKFIADAVVKKRFTDARKCREIIRAHFKPGTELYREFRLFNALVKTRVDHVELATRILSEAREATKKINQVKLRSQKSALIKDINHKLNEDNFYNRRVVDYKNYATIQTLMNDWRRDKSTDIARITKFENGVCKWLLQEDNAKSYSVIDHGESSDPLTYKIFFQKFNQKYGGILNDKQVKILNAYALNSSNKNNSLANQLKILQEDVLDDLNEYIRSCNNDILVEKYEGVINKILTFEADDINERVISRALMLAGLQYEILGDGDEKA
tara:strand:- start:913 stop:1773 length:861 start_codon:yes stop_codon:yes gene_type:complete